MNALPTGGVSAVYNQLNQQEYQFITSLARQFNYSSGPIVNQLDGLQEFKDQVSELTSQIVVLGGQVDSNTSLVQQVESQVNALDTQVQQIASDVDSLDTALAANINTVNSLLSRVTATEQQITLNTNAILSNTSSINSTSTQVANNVTAINSLQARMTSSEAQLGVQAVQIANNSQNITSLGQQVAINTADISTNTSNITTLNTKLNTLITQVKAQTNKIRSGTVAVGALSGTSAALTVTGSITSASKAPGTGTGPTIVTINYADLGYAPLIITQALTTLPAADNNKNDFYDAMLTSVSNTQGKILIETANPIITFNVLLHVTLWDPNMTTATNSVV